MDINVKKKYEFYPDKAKEYFLKIRNIVLEVALTEGLGEVEETLKWGEPSYCVKGGSPIRVDWKPQHANQISVYFNCKTSLIETFKEVFGDVFKYQGNRELMFLLAEELPLAELKICISLSLRYHKVKKLFLLGI